MILRGCNSTYRDYDYNPVYNWFLGRSVKRLVCLVRLNLPGLIFKKLPNPFGSVKHICSTKHMKS